MSASSLSIRSARFSVRFETLLVVGAAAPSELGKLHRKPASIISEPRIKNLNVN